MRKSLSLTLLVFLLCAFCNLSRAQDVINTIAGNGVGGYSGDGGPAVNSQVNFSFGVAVDAGLNVYIADAANNVVRMINGSTGVITTIAGNGTAGSIGDGGLAVAAELNNPTGVAVDAAGNIYIADEANNEVREITVLTGIINTIAGNGTAGFSGDGTPAVGAQLNNPYGVALDAAGNVYIADAGNNRIREITVATGIISTEAGSSAVGAYGGDGGISTLAQLNYPQGVAVDASGNVYIADTYNDVIREVSSSSGIISTVAGNGTLGFVAGLATSSGLNLPTGVGVDATGNFYIADVSNQQVEMVTLSTGNISVLAGTGAAGYNGDCITPTTAQVSNPSGVAVDIAGNVYFADRGNSRIREILPPCTGTPNTPTLVASPSYGCAAFTTTLTATGAPTGCGITYQWQSSTDGVTYTPILGATGVTFVTNVTANTYFNLVVSCTYSGASTTSAPIELLINPSGTIAPITGGFSPMCTGMTVNLASTTTGGTWSVANTNASITTGGALTASTAGIDTVFYSAIALCNLQTDTFVVIIDPTQTPAVTISVYPGGTVCTGDSVIVSGVMVSGGAEPTFQWLVNGVNFGAPNQDSIKYVPNNGDTVTCTLTSSYFCASPSVVRDSVVILVQDYIRPGISMNDASYGDSVCQAVPITFYVVDTNGGGLPSNTWVVNNVIVGSGTSFTYTPTNGDSIYCRLISSFVCAAPDTVYSPSKVMSVYNSETPAVTIFEAGGDTTCPLYNATFTAHGFFGGLDPFYRWAINHVYRGTGPDFSFVPSTGDTVFCMMISNSTCRSLDSAFSNTVITTVDSVIIPSVSISSSNGDTLVSGNAVTLTAITSGGGTNPSFQWYLNGNPVSGATNSTYTTSSLVNGDFVACVLISDFTCANPSAAASSDINFVVIKAGVNNLTTTSINATVYPNPNNGSFAVQAGIGKNNGAVLEITDVLGQTKYKSWVAAQNGQILQEVNLNNDFADGVYLLHITTGNETEMVKFVVGR